MIDATTTALSQWHLANWRLMWLGGPITITTKPTRTPSGESPSRVHLTLPVSSLRRSPLRPSSPTPPSESVWESNSRKTTRESLASCPEMVVCLSSMRTTKSSLPVSVVQAMPSVIFRESDSRLSRLPQSLSTPSGSERRKSQSSERAWEAWLPARFILKTILVCYMGTMQLVCFGLERRL